MWEAGLEFTFSMSTPQRVDYMEANLTWRQYKLNREIQTAVLFILCEFVISFSHYPQLADEWYSNMYNSLTMSLFLSYHLRHLSMVWSTTSSELRRTQNWCKLKV